MILVDSDAYIALFFTRDIHHKKSLQFSEYLVDKRIPVLTTWDVIDEVTTRLARKINKNIANTFLKTILPTTRLEYINSLRSLSARKLFLQQNDPRVSITDCSNMVIAKELGISTIFSFDHHYLRSGFLLLTEENS